MLARGRRMLAKCAGKMAATAKGCRRGVAAAEFAICLPVMFAILAGLWEIDPNSDWRSRARRLYDLVFTGLRA